ncbi:MAG: hypothetical protein DRO88_03780 [Promethearchaeia archaeon]|nr:MAG: hypothetical protein DRO88_03780 [Candidatus Lokiarchaeia archaeon]
MNDLHFIQEYKPIAINFKDFSSKQINITYNFPLFCTISKMLQTNQEKGFTSVMIEDVKGEQMLGFVYQQAAEILARLSPSLFPLTVIVFKGVFKTLPSKQRFLEIHHIILDNFTFINSSAIGGHEYCEIQSFLDLYYGVSSEPNEYLLWGNLIHDYLAELFGELNSWKMIKKISKMSILRAFEIALAHNWQYLAVLGKSENEIREEFLQNFAVNEWEFLQTHFQEYRKKYNSFEVFCEKFVQSPVIGLQGRIDRLILDNQNHQCTIIETKTGRSKRSSQLIAYYQGLTYGVILNDLFNWRISEILIEYPRHPPSERFAFYPVCQKKAESKDINRNKKDENTKENDFSLYETPDFLRIIQIRNKIWSFLNGLAPKKIPDTPCAQCNSKSKCVNYRWLFPEKFYPQSTSAITPDKNPSLTNYIRQEILDDLIRQNLNLGNISRSLKQCLRFYLEWFYYFIDQEFLMQKHIRLESFNNISIQEEKGLAIGGLKLKLNNIGKFPTERQENENGSAQYMFEMYFTHQIESQNSRFRAGDYVVITPETLNKYKIGGLSGILVEITANSLIVSTIESFTKFGSNYNEQVYRIDFSVSNYHLWQYKGAIDQFLQAALQPAYPHHSLLRDILLNQQFPRSIPKKLDQIYKNSKLNQLSNESSDSRSIISLNESQEEAVKCALQAKRLALIQGPPGTGKTTVIVEIIHRYLSSLTLSSQDSQSHNSGMSGTTEKRRKGTLNRFIQTKNRYVPPRIPILLCAYTNKAVDTVVEKLVQSYPKIKCIRVGNVHSSSSTVVKSYNLEVLSTVKKKIQTSSGEKEQFTVDPLKVRMLLESADVIATTTIKAGTLLLQPYSFVLTIIDEAGQVVEPGVLIPLLKGKKGILVGDHQQLPPITHFSPDIEEKNLQILQNSSIREKLNFDWSNGINRSLFERLIPQFKGTNNFSLLKIQYRMHKTISQFISQTFYQGELIPGEIEGRNIGEISWLDIFTKYYEKFDLEEIKTRLKSPVNQLIWASEQSMIFLDTADLQAFDSSKINSKNIASSKFNTTEVKIIASITKAFLDLLQISNFSQEVIQEIFSNLGIISPYRAHNAKIIKMIKKTEIFEHISVDTVDRFQGNEKEVIIYSFVDSCPEHIISSLTADYRRLNVAISRARSKIIFIGDSTTLTTISTEISPQTAKIKSIISQLIVHVKKNGGYWLMQPNDYYLN